MEESIKYFTVLTEHSANPFHCGNIGLLVVWFILILWRNQKICGKKSQFVVCHNPVWIFMLCEDETDLENFCTDVMDEMSVNLT